MLLKYIIVIFLIILIILIIFNQPLYSNQKCLERFMVHENFEDLLTSTKLLSKVDKKKWFHDPYTYNYASTDYIGRTDQNEILLSFLCFKFEGKKKEEWEKSGISNPMEYLKKIIKCKTTIHDLEGENPTSIINIKKKLALDLEGEMNSYSKLTNVSILAPVYCIIVQYPNKYYKDDNGSKGYKYTQFDIEDNNIKPYERKNLSTGAITFSCNEKDCETIIDTKIMFVYTMYTKETIDFYPTICSTYLLKKLPNNIKLFEKLDLTKEEKKKKQMPGFKGIIDFIKDINSNGLEITKDQSCFIECKNNSSIYCGCATRLEGVDDPKDIIKEDSLVSMKRYKSYCKEKYNSEKEETNELFSHYCLVYRINELNTENITDIELDIDTEKRITYLLKKDGCIVESQITAQEN
jgi:predicted peroxiredoxin